MNYLDYIKTGKEEFDDKKTIEEKPKKIKLTKQERIRKQYSKTIIEYANSLKESERLRSEITKGVKAKENERELLRKAIQCISLLTGDNVFGKLTDKISSDNLSFYQSDLYRNCIHILKVYEADKKYIDRLKELYSAGNKLFIEYFLFLATNKGFTEEELKYLLIECIDEYNNLTYDEKIKYREWLKVGED